ncbi:rod shape-determining protein MreC [Tepidibacillus fermentans]|uniref:Cell shape-determining protein MreC n=1 Tax=Tepidibacillus fermentans TaxID=1281767 RepID=A0A4R3K8S3_9BACI|nr:rod shape-determining protein MreC [Tepidibacillus fermentans]TCS79061.1 rod shape-determining protein MreC [Tepidibacillus fermentans]
MFSKLFSNKHLIILLFSLILLFILVWTTLGSRELTWPEKFVKDSTSMIQGFIYKPANAVAGFFQDMYQFSLIFKENKALKSSLHQYSQVIAELNQLRAENQKLKEMLDYKEKAMNQYQLKMAKVISRSPERWNNMLVIDQGLKDGIQKDMAVITTQGLIGKVYNVSNFSANVQLISDSEHGGFIFAAIQSNPQAYGVIDGYDVTKNELRLTKIELDVKLEPGQLVTTSNLGGTFPNGLVIGKIVRVDEGENGFTKTAYVKPEANLYHIDDVFVVQKTGVKEGE